MGVLLRPGEKPTFVAQILIFLSTAQDIFSIFALLYFLLRAIIKYGPGWFVYASKIVGLYGAQAIVALAVIAIGVGAHKLKQKKQRWYGRIEVAFGAAAAVNLCFTLLPGQSLFSQWAALIGCAYIIARGLGNYTDAKEAPKPVEVAL